MERNSVKERRTKGRRGNQMHNAELWGRGDENKGKENGEEREM